MQHRILFAGLPEIRRSGSDVIVECVSRCAAGHRLDLPQRDLHPLSLDALCADPELERLGNGGVNIWEGDGREIRLTPLTAAGGRSGEAGGIPGYPVVCHGSYSCTIAGKSMYNALT